jgi:hypothetical protein
MFVKGNRSKRERKDCQIARFSFSFSFSLEEREGRRVEEAWFKHARMKKRRRFGDHFPPKSPTRRRFGDHIHPKSPTRRRFILTSFPPNFPRWTSPFFLSFMVSVDKWVWAFFTTSDINIVLWVII